MPFVTRLPALTGADPYPDALLALDFVGARRGPQYYKSGGVTTADITRIPGWTYTGGTPAGTGSYAPKADGSLQFFPSVTNYAFQSQTIDNAGWTKLATTVTANATAAPDGTLTADKLEDTATTNSHGVAEASFGSYGANTYTGSVYVKAAEYGFAFIWIDSGSGDGVTAQINLSSGAATMSRGAGGTWTSPSATSVNAGNGWWRVAVTGTTTLTAGVQLRVFQAPTAFTTGSYGTPSYAGTAGSGIYLWGAQLELGSTASTYIPTTTAAVTVAPPRITDAGYLAEEARTNLLTYSQQFDNAAWTKTAVTVTANQAVAPDGTLTADALTETAVTSQHVLMNFTSKAASPITYTATWYVKQFGTARNAKVTISDGGGAGADYIVNPVTGAVASGPTYYGGVPFTAATVVVTQVANGFAKIDITATTNSNTTVVAILQPASGTTLSYLGATDTGFYVWQADLQAGSFATSPIPTTSVAVTRSADVGYISGLTVPSAVSLLVNFSRPAAAATNFGGAVSLNAGAANVNEIYITRHSSTAVRGYVISASSTKEAMVGTVSAGQDSVSAALRSETSNGNGAVGGVLSPGSQTATVVAPIGANTLFVGLRDASSAPNNGVVRRIVIYPRAMSNSELQAVTTAGAY